MNQLMSERNWAGNHEYAAATIARPANLAELRETVAGSEQVRALGSRHSFNAIADTPGTLVVLDRLPDDITLDAGNLTVTVSGGTRYGALAAELHRRGFALHNLASLPHISIAGAVATATHGSGDTNGNLATSVAAVQMVTADGSIITARRGDAGFEGMVVGLGALGIVTRLTLDVQPTFEVSQSVYEDLAWDTVLECFDGITSSAYSVSLFTDWSGGGVQQAWLKSRIGDRCQGGRSDCFFGARPATEARHPLPGVSGMNCTQQLGDPGPWSDRLSHFRMEFTPSKGDELQSEYLIPRRHATDALHTVRQLSHLVTPLLLVGEIRTVAGDQLWLSPNYERDSVALHFTWRPDQAAVEALLPLLEVALAPYEARPHWGKLFGVRGAALRTLYPRMDDFTALARQLDPAGKFRNCFLDQTVFGT